MKTQILTLLSLMLVVLTSCNVGYNSIQDITFNPDKYQNKLVKVMGSTCLSISFNPSNPSYICLQDNYDNLIKLSKSCGGEFSDSWSGRKGYIAFGVYKDGWVNCLVPIYKEGNEPPKVKEYESGKLTPEGTIITSSKCKNIVKEGNIEKCAD